MRETIISTSFRKNLLSFQHFSFEWKIVSTSFHSNEKTFWHHFIFSNWFDKFFEISTTKHKFFQSCFSSYKFRFKNFFCISILRFEYVYIDVMCWSKYRSTQNVYFKIKFDDLTKCFLNIKLSLQKKNSNNYWLRI